ncbi:MAG: response regulator transcription factor [Bacteroidota bacterium]
MKKQKGKTVRPVNEPKPIFVWLVDDNTQFTHILNETLSDFPVIQCTKTYANGDTMLQSFVEESDFPDIILLDINMPGSSGIETLAQIRILAPSIRVLMLTVSLEDSNIQQAIQLGAAGYLLKTASVEEIVHALQSTMQGGMPIDPFIARKVFSLFSLDVSNVEKYSLTNKEKEVIRFIIKGWTTDKVAKELHLSPNTVHSHLKKVFLKLDVHTRHELVAKALQERLT